MCCWFCLSILNAASPEAPPQSAEAPGMAQLATPPPQPASGLAQLDALLAPQPLLPPMPDALDSLNTRLEKRSARATALVTAAAARGHKRAAPERPDFTASHMSAIKDQGDVIVECGGGGDCFFHVCAWLAQVFVQDWRLPRTHEELRIAVANHLRSKWTSIEVQPKVEVLTLMKGRTRNPDRPAKDIVNGFCKKWGAKHCCKLCFAIVCCNCSHPTVVENEMIAAFADLANAPVVVYNLWEEEVHVICPQKVVRRRQVENLTNHRSSAYLVVQRTPFVLWCNGGHYQAIVPLARFSVSDTQTSSFRFQESNVVDKEHLSLVCD